MHKILNGIHEFRSQVFPARRGEFEKLAAGQQPSTLFITCSDSRIVPHLLTQTEPGELFVLRNAGNLVPPYKHGQNSGEAATIEYAVKVLKVESIVVCGHSHCGAINGLLNPDSLKDLPAVREWLAHAQATREIVLENAHDSQPSGDLLSAAIMSNVLVQLSHLRTYPAVVGAETRGDLTLHGCFYRFETGEITEFDEAAKEFIALGPAPSAEAATA